MPKLLEITLLIWVCTGEYRTYIIESNSIATWEEASSYCLSEYGTTLATVIDTDDKEALKAAAFDAGLSMPYRVWIGLTDKVNENYWEWEDGSECRNLEPACIDYWSDQESDENCGEIDVDTDNKFLANDVSCTKAYIDSIKYAACNTDVIITATPRNESYETDEIQQYCLDNFGTNAASVGNLQDYNVVHKVCSPLPANYNHATLCCLGGDNLSGIWDWYDGNDNTLILNTTNKYDNGGLWAASEPHGGAGENRICVVGQSKDGLHDCSIHDCYPICSSPIKCGSSAAFVWEELIQEEIKKPDITYNLTVNDANLSLTIDVMVPYLGKTAADNNGYVYGTTYVLDFEDYDAHSDTITEPGSCQNRVASDFSGKLFDEIWEYSRSPHSDGVGTVDYLAYAPGGKWTLTMAEDCDHIRYSATLTWVELTSCGNSDLSVNYISTADGSADITLSGTFYVNVVSPFDYKADYNFYRVYQLLSQPFSIVVHKSVYVVDSVGINLLTMDIISVYKENKENNFKLVVLTESAEYLKLSRSDLNDSLFSLADSVMHVTDFSVATNSETDTAASAQNGCLNNKGYICSQLWVIQATDDGCNVTDNRFTDFSGKYGIEFNPQCRTEAELSATDNASALYSYCAGDDTVDNPGWLNNHLSQLRNDADKVILSSMLMWKDEICDPIVFNVQFDADMEFFVNGYTSAAHEHQLYQVGEDSVYVRITANYPNDHLSVFFVELQNVWICTFDPLEPPKLDFDVGQLEGGCHSTAPDGVPDAVDPEAYNTHIYERNGDSTTSFESFELDTLNTLSHVIQFKFDVPNQLVRDTLYIHAEIQVSLTSGRRRRMMMAVDTKEVNQINHFVDQIEVTKEPQPQPHHYPQQPQQPQPYTPPQQPFVNSFKSSWVMAIAGLLVLVLTVNIMFMCYMKRRPYTPVKDADSEFYSEHDPINVVSE